MLYFTCENRTPLQHVSSGKLVNQENFVHSRRNLDTFVLLVGVEGTLYIAQDERRYELGSNQFLILFPGHEHYGYRPSSENLTYYWCHFRAGDNRYLLKESDSLAFLEDGNLLSQCYILPEHGTLSSGDRTSLVFKQLLDLSSKHCYSDALTNYTLSLLALEITQELMDFVPYADSDRNALAAIAQINEWIRINSDRKLSVREIAREFHYNPDYLSALFKKHTGVSLLKHIHRAKISLAKQLLLNSSASVKQIALSCGWQDEKAFMKLFRQSEDVTPTQYRRAFYHTSLNKK